MVAKTAARAEASGLANHICARNIGAHDLSALVDEGAAFDGAYSNFGPLNCVPDLGVTARQCARLIVPGGSLIFTVIGRVCPWEVAHYVLKGRLKRARVRYERGITAVNLNKHTVWTRYYTPREFYAPFARDFALARYSALSLFVPPPYLTGLYDQARPAFDALAWIDDKTAGWPVFRDMGDHFLIVMTRRA
jgi:SAM-dependent methyltransferase